MIKGLLRRLRKQAVRQKATMTDICQALYAARCLNSFVDGGTPIITLPFCGAKIRASISRTGPKRVCGS